MKRTIVCWGELLLRLSAPGHERWLQSPRFEVHVGGAEANVAAGLAGFGQPVAMLGAVADNALGAAALGELRRAGVDTTRMRREPGRMGLYFFEQGALQRPSEVLYDRADSAFARLPASAWDWPALLADAAHLHVSGITPALGAESAQAALDAVRAARSMGVTVSVDGNYRPKLWQAWGGDAPRLLRALMAEADGLFVNHRDLGLALGIVDRIGGGDAFAAGILHGRSRGWSTDEVLAFGLAAGAYKHSQPGDALRASEADIRAWQAGGADVRR